MRSRGAAALFAGTVVIICLAGCGRSPVARFYTLAATEVATGEGRDTGPALAVGPMQVPRVLSHKQIVNRVSPHRVELEEYHLWASSLEFDSLSVLAQNLCVLLDTRRVVAYPAEPPFPIDYRVRLEVTRFDGRDGGEVVLEVGWAVVPAGGGDSVAFGRTTLRQDTGGPGMEALVRAHSEALGGLSREIAEAISAAHALRRADQL